MSQSQEARSAYDTIGAELAATAPATMGQMFGMPCLKIEGKAFAGLYNDAMVFKLAGEAHARALALPGARLFDPGDRGRAMKEWVEVPSDHASSWPELGRDALSYVSGAR